MKVFFFLLSLLFTISISAQEPYSKLTSQASTIVKKQDSLNYTKASKLLEEAFSKYPDSIQDTDTYYASILYSELKDLDKAFKYLTPLVAKETDDEGFPGWTFVLDSYAQEDYINLLEDSRWIELTKKASIDKKRFFTKLNQQQAEFFNVSEDLKIDESAEEIYQNLKNFNPFKPKFQQNYSISFPVNDTLNTSYLVHLPANYNPQRKYSALIFLHGAVRFNNFSEYQIAQQVLVYGNKFLTKHGDLNNVILIFPSADKGYNWMNADAGFFIVPKIVKQLKSALNINDNKVFVTGHSNGASGSFSYAMKQPTQFAGFYGFNTFPKVFTGGTFIRNILNRSFLNFSTDQDYYYPPNANDSLNKLMSTINADYKDQRFNGFPHWFPDFDESEIAFKSLFADLKIRERNPFPDKLEWEFDDDKYGAIDWLGNIKLDTLQSRKQWHQNLNFKIEKRLKYDDKDVLVEYAVDENAFNFPRKSGKIIAEYKDNTFKIQTSCISSFTVLISPEMVNLNKKVKIYLNGKLLKKLRVRANKELIIQNYQENNDRIQIWVDEIKIKV